jgi:4-hydroxy-tetrahydrodipicolinate reductase
MIKIALSGACGKMGRRIGSLALDDGAFRIVGTLEKGGSEFLGKDYGAVLGRGPLGVLVTSAPEDCIRGAEVVVDFSTPSGTLALVPEAVKAKKAMVIGVTGFSDAEREVLRKASTKIPILLSPNMSIGVNLVFGLVKETFEVLGRDYRVHIKEAHHVHKKDAPSGTAKEIARLIRESRPDAEIPIESIREGEIVGDHTVTFESPFDRIQISHSAKTRDIFAKGALRAALFLKGRSKGLYAMREALKFKQD